MPRLFGILALVIGAGVASAPAHADLFRNIGGALGHAGFTLEGQRNVLSGGIDFSVRRNLQGNTLDFGAWDLTLQGPVAFELSTGGRNLSQFDLRASTSRGDGAGAVPLNYVLNYDVGGQETRISGTLLTDVDFSLNGFGFYDLGITHSSRQNVLREGRFANDQNEFDFDLGPIQVSGNVFADALAVITEPIFQAAGVVNPFASFSGRVQLEEAMDASARALVEQLAAGKDVTTVDAAFVMAPEITAIDSDGNGLLLRGGQSDPIDGVVPEPSVVVLVLLGVPFLLHRRLFFRRSV